jgi:large subunit ribosomal protein L19
MSKIANDIKPGDQVKVKRKVIEGDKERIQEIEGLVIARKHGNEVGATITVRKIASGVGVEFVFPLNSPLISEIKISKRYKVRRSKLYYLRELSGKAAKLKEKENYNLEELNKTEEQPQIKEKKPKEEKSKDKIEETKAEVKK